MDTVQDDRGTIKKSHLMDLPAELRNRVYEFANEDPSFEKCSYAPRIRRCYMGYPPSWGKRHWKYFALTQVCRQIRNEYRPLWIQNLRFRAEFYDDWEHNVFMPDTLPYGSSMVHATSPAVVQLMKPITCLESTTITHLLEIRAIHSKTVFEIVARSLFFHKFRGQNKCRFCLEYCHMNGTTAEEALRSQPHDGCDPDTTRAQLGPWQAELYWLKRRQSIEMILSNTNEKWLEAVRGKHVSVEFDYDSKDEACVITINVDAVMWSGGKSASEALAMLHEWGISEAMVGKTVYKVTHEELKEESALGNRVYHKIMHEITLKKSM